MKDFERNTEIVIMPADSGKKVSYFEGQNIDFIQIFNQYHNVGRWIYSFSLNKIRLSKEIFDILKIPFTSDYMNFDSFINFFFSTDVAVVKKIFLQSYSMKTGFKLKLRINNSEGNIRFVEINAAPILSKSGSISSITGIFRDITSQTEFENTRNSQTDLIKNTIKSLPISAIFLDKSLTIIDVSNQFIIDFNLKDYIEKNTTNYRDIVPSIYKMQSKNIEMALKGVQIGGDNEKLKTNDGLSYLIDWRMQPWMDKRGDVGGLLIMMRVNYTGFSKNDGMELLQGPKQKL